MWSEDNLQVEFLPPTRIVRDQAFLLPVIITCTAETVTDEFLTGILQIEAGLAFKPHQKKEIQFGHLNPGQKIVLTWILLATKEGTYRVTIHLHATNNVVIKKTAWLVVRP